MVLLHSLQSVQEISHIFFELADKVRYSSFFLSGRGIEKNYTRSQLKQKWHDILDGHESSDIDITPFLHMLS